MNQQLSDLPNFLPLPKPYDMYEQIYVSDEEIRNLGPKDNWTLFLLCEDRWVYICLYLHNVQSVSNATCKVLFKYDINDPSKGWFDAQKKPSRYNTDGSIFFSPGFINLLYRLIKPGSRVRSLKDMSRDVLMNNSEIILYNPLNSMHEDRPALFDNSYVKVSQPIIRKALYGFDSKPQPPFKGLPSIKVDEYPLKSEDISDEMLNKGGKRSRRSRRRRRSNKRRLNRRSKRSRK